MVYNMGDGKKIFKTNLVLFFVLISFQVSRCINSTVCYGSPGLQCTTHILSCPSPLVIQIINTSYGYRPGCNNVVLASCSNTTCCNEEPGDCYISFSSEEYQQVVRNCSGLETCEIRGFRRYNNTVTVCDGRKVSAYSKIQYDCVSKDLSTSAQTTVTSTSELIQEAEEDTATSTYSTDLTASTSSTIHFSTDAKISTTSTTRYSTDLTVSTSSTPCPRAKSDNLGVVGGVLGSLLIISVIINVGLAVYITRTKKFVATTTRENNCDGITNIELDQTPNSVDALQVQSTASSNHDDKKKSDNNHTYYYTIGDSLSRDSNPYLEVF